MHRRGQGDWRLTVDESPCGKENLFDFIEKHGGVADGLGFGVGATGLPDIDRKEGRILVATRPFRQGEILAKIPHNISMSIFTALDSPVLGPLFHNVLVAAERERFGNMAGKGSLAMGVS